MLVFEIAAGVTIGLLVYRLLVRTRLGIWLAYAAAVLIAGLVLLVVGLIVWAKYQQVINDVLALAGAAMVIGFVAWVTKRIREDWATWDRKKRREVLIGGGGLHLIMSGAMAGPASEQGYGWATFLTLWLVPYLMLWGWFRLPANWPAPAAVTDND